MIYTDETPMEFGAHKGRPIKDVPAKYLLHMEETLSRRDWMDFQIYVRKNKPELRERANKETVNNMLK